MTRMKICLALCSAVLVAATAGTTLAAVSGAHLFIAGKNPLTVRATGFRPAERVTVQAASKGMSGRLVATATSTGTFVARFRSIDASGCAMIAVRATGNRGSSAALKIVPECAQPATP